MILENTITDERLNSPNNLVNRLAELRKVKVKSDNGLSLFGVKVDSNPATITALPEDVSKTVDAIGESLRDNLTANKARAVLDSSLSILSARIHEIDKAKDLSRVALDMGKVISGLEGDKDENKNAAPTIIYRPVINNESHYAAVYVTD